MLPHIEKLSVIKPKIGLNTNLFKNQNVIDCSIITVLTGADCSSLTSICPTTDCCGTGVKDTSKTPNTATDNI